MTEIPPSVPDFDAVTEVMEISHEKLLAIPGKSTFMFHHNFYLEPKIDLKVAEISEGTRQKL